MRTGLAVFFAVWLMGAMLGGALIVYVWQRLASYQRRQPRR